MSVIPVRIWVMFDGFEDNIGENPVVSPVLEPHRLVIRSECIEIVITDDGFTKPIFIVVSRPSPFSEASHSKVDERRTLLACTSIVVRRNINLHCIVLSVPNCALNRRQYDMLFPIRRRPYRASRLSCVVFQFLGETNTRNDFGMSPGFSVRVLA